MVDAPVDKVKRQKPQATVLQRAKIASSTASYIHFECTTSRVVHRTVKTLPPAVKLV
jgi:hypothetical protein